jgi:hypothetical protein
MDVSETDGSPSLTSQGSAGEAHQATSEGDNLRGAIVQLQIQLAEIRVSLAGLEQSQRLLEQQADQTSRLPPMRMLPWGRLLRGSRREIGGALTVTGIFAIVAGIVLHLALQHNMIASVTHLGYIVGLIGLFAYLLGILLVL